MVVANIFVMILFAIVIAFGVLIESFRVAKKLKKDLPAVREDGTRRPGRRFNAGDIRSTARTFNPYENMAEDMQRRRAEMQRRVTRMSFGDVKTPRWTFKVVDNRLYSHTLDKHPEWCGPVGLIAVESLVEHQNDRVLHHMMTDHDFEGVAQSQYRGTYRRPVYAFISKRIEAKRIGMILTRYLNLTNNSNLILTDTEYSKAIANPMLCPEYNVNEAVPCFLNVPVYE